MISRRRCSHCKEPKKLLAFATYRGRDGQLHRRGICRECRDTYATENFARLQEWRRDYNARTRDARCLRNAARRAEAKAFVDAYKAARPCADCGRFFPPVAVDLDHVRGAKTRAVAGLVSGAYKLDLIRLEIAKCDVVCACCHRIRTAARKENLAPPLAKVQRARTGG